MGNHAHARCRRSPPTPWREAAAAVANSASFPASSGSTVAVAVIISSLSMAVPLSASAVASPAAEDLVDPVDPEWLSPPSLASWSPLRAWCLLYVLPPENPASVVSAAPDSAAEPPLVVCLLCLFRCSACFLKRIFVWKQECCQILWLVHLGTITCCQLAHTIPMPLKIVHIHQQATSRHPSQQLTS